MEFFATNEWRWSQENVDKLSQELTEEDKQTFCFDISKLNWVNYIENYCKVRAIGGKRDGHYMNY